MAMESEIKFTVPDRRLFAEIAALREIASFEARDKGLIRHRDTYFDTGDLLLLRSKAVFRLRESRNNTTLAFKAQAASADGIYRRIEVEAPADISAGDIERGNLPPAPPVDELQKRFGNISLRTALTAENNRQIIELAHAGIPRFEIALDDVAFTGPRETANILELEVESLGGEDASLRDIGAWLKERFALKSAGPSKYILGMQLAGRRE